MSSINPVLEQLPLNIGLQRINLTNYAVLPSVILDKSSLEDFHQEIYQRLQQVKEERRKMLKKEHQQLRLV